MTEKNMALNLISKVITTVKKPVCCFWLIGLISIVQTARSQSPSAAFNLPATGCLGENIHIVNTSSNATGFLWDFCSNDLNTLSSIGEAKVVSGALIPTGITMIFDQGNWYGFLSSRDNNKIFRLDFGNNLENSPTINDLGNVGGLLVQPQNLEFVKEGSSIYGLLTNFGNSRLIRFSFSSGINNAPTAQDLGNIGGWSFLRGLDIVKEGSSYTAFVSDFINNRVSIVNFGNSITNNPGAGDVTHISTSIGGPIGVRLIMHESNWFAFVASHGTNTIKRLNFGSTLSASPVIDNIYTIERPTEISLQLEGNDFHIHSISEGGNLHHVRLSTAMNVTAGENLGNGGMLNNTFGFDVVRSAPFWYGFTVNYANNKIYRIKFMGDCAGNMSSNTSNSQDPLDIQYYNPGNYFVELNAINGTEISVLTKEIVIQNLESPEVSIASNNICFSSDIAFTATTEQGTTLNSWNWNFGDNQTSTAPSPTHQYTAPATYTITLNVSATNTCNNRAVKLLTVYAPPDADFTVPTGLMCTNNEFTFVNNTVNDADGNATYQWYVGNEPVSVTKDLKYTFTNTGIAQIKLKATVPGCSDEVTQSTPVIQSGPILDFSFLGKCTNNEIQFTSNITEAVTSSSWDFDDGGSSTEINPKHTYVSPGQFSVSLSALSTNGCNNTKTKTVPIYSLPIVNFTTDAPPFSCSGSETPFTNQTPNPSDGIVTTWQWDFGDTNNNTSVLKDPKHTFTTAGGYNVRLTATTTEGCSGSLQKSITIAQSPTVNISNSLVCNTLPVNFTATGSNIFSYYWEIGTFYYSVANPTHTFNAPGNYQTKLTVKSSNNCEAIQTKNISVPIPLLPDFAVVKNCVGHQATFTDITTGVDVVAQRNWDFAGLGTATGTPTTFIYNTIGNKSIKLTVTGQSGCSYSRTKTVAIIPPPVADFTVTPESGATPLNVQFTNKSTGTTQYIWSFGDASGASSTDATPVHIFDEVGDYVTELTASNNEGCESKFSKRISVVPASPDVDLKTITTSENPDGTMQVIITVQNKGNTFIKDLPVDIDISGAVSLREIIEETIAPYSLYNLVLSYSLNQTNSLKFLCANALLQNDLAPEGNRICAELDNSVFLFTPYPNPVRSELYIDWIAPQEETIDILLVDAFGKQILAAAIQSAQGLNQRVYNISKVQSGIYFLVLNAGTVSKTQRIFISPQN